MTAMVLPDLASLSLSGNASSAQGGDLSESGISARFSPCKQLRATLYGETTLCQDERKQKQLVVLKRISLKLLRANAEHARENPTRERDVIDLLRKTGGHAHIVKYEDQKEDDSESSGSMFVHEDDLYIVMEYCSGGDLYDYVCKKPESRMHEIEALRFFHQIASGVQFLHANGIAHRDLSLENVLLESGHAKICDFGLSTDANEPCEDVVGKLYYMAPEVVRAQAPYDPKKADVWSLGILLFILLTGSPLIADETPREATLKVLEKCGVSKILEMWELQKLMAKGTVELLEAMLQVDAEKRASIECVLQHPALSLFDKA